MENGKQIVTVKTVINRGSLKKLLIADSNLVNRYGYAPVAQPSAMEACS